MNKEEIFLKLKSIFGLVIGQDKKNVNITLQTKIIEDLCLTSVAMVYMLFAIEKEFQISLPKIKKDTFKTIEDVVNLIYSKIH